MKQPNPKRPKNAAHNVVSVDKPTAFNPTAPDAILREKSERLQLALRATGMGTWEMDLVNNRRIWSDETLAMHGMDRKAAGNGHIELNDFIMHPDDRKRVLELHRELRAGRDDYAFEYRSTLNGQERWIEARGTVLDRTLQGPTRIVGVSSDITERKLAEEFKRLSDERFQILADAMPQLVWIGNAKGEITYFNSRCASYNLSAAVDGVFDWRSLVHADDFEPTKNAWQSVVATHNSYEMEHRLQFADGRYAWHLSRATCVLVGKGTIPVWYGSSTDVDALKQTEARLFESEQRLRLATESADMFAWEVDLIANKIRWANNAAEVIGCPPELLTDDPGTSTFYIRPQDHQRILEEFNVAMRSGGDTYSLQFAGPASGKATITWQSHGKFIRNTSGKVERVVGVTQNISKRKSAELALEVIAERFITAEDAAGFMVYDWDVAAGTVWHSGGLTKILGWLPHEVAPHPQFWIDLQHPEDRERVAYHKTAEIVTTDDNFVMEYRVRHRTGHYLWMMDSGRVFRDGSGTIVRQAGAVIDISTRKESEEELRRQANLIDLSFEPIFAWHPTRGIVEWNKGAEQVYGYTREEALGRNSHQLLRTLHPLPLPELQKMEFDHGQWSGELEHTAKDGRKLTVESRHQLIDANGEVLVLETNRDITERKKAEAFTARMAAVALASHDALYGATPQGMIEAWNPGAERLFGYAAAEAIGQHISMLAQPNKHMEQQAMLADVASGKTVGPLDTMRIRKDGTIVEVSLAVAPVKAPNGTVVAISAAVHDISDRKEWEKRQRLMTRELAHRGKNSFAILQAILRSTLKASPDPNEFASAFSGRLHSMAAAQDILTESNWKGAELGALAMHQLSNYVVKGSAQFVISGSPINLHAEHAAPFALILNELATNALKYGALSVPTGKIDLSWRTEITGVGKTKLIFSWCEQGGPRISTVGPRSFGTTLIERSLPDARVELTLHPDGLICVIELELVDPQSV